MGSDAEDEVPWFFKADMALTMAKLSQQAYEKPENINLESLNLKLDLPFNFSRDKEDTQGFVCSDENSVFIVFRGTSNLFDLVTDLKVFRNKIGWAKKFLRRSPKAHYGFLNAYEPAHQRLIPDVLNMLQGRQLFITGHSLGGALATLCALDLAWKHGVPVHLYTFGSPRVGDKRMYKKFKKFVPHSARVRNHNDKIPLFPNLFYKHVPHIVHISEDGNFIAKNKKWDKSVVEAKNQDQGGDHRIANYIKAMEMIKVAQDMKPFGGGKY